MDSSVDASKKLPLEDLPKEEIIKKYRGLLNILQKAKQSKDSLIEENNNLKHKLETQANSGAAEEVLENLTQQKLNLVTSLEEIKGQKDVIHNRLKDCEINLSKAENKIIELDTENQSYKRQVNRLTEENEQLLTHLDTLEKQTEELKKIGLQQQQQLLELEKSDASSELLEKVKASEALKVEYDEIKKTSENLMHTNKDLTEENKLLTEKHAELTENIEMFRINYKNAELLITNLKATIEEKNKRNETYINTTDDLNIELHKNKALVEKLQQDIANMSNRLSNNQIVSSGVASDLQNTNEKLKDKLKFYHSKIVKFAGDVKILKQHKMEILENFKNYVQQVKLWEAQLKEFSGKVIDQFRELEEERAQLKAENGNLKVQIVMVESDNGALKGHNNELAGNLEVLKSKLENDQFDKLSLDNKHLNEQINKSLKQIDELKGELETLHVERSNFKQQSEDLTNELKILKDRQEKEVDDLQVENRTLLENLQQKLEENNKLVQKVTDLECKLQELAQTHDQALTNLQAELQLLKSAEIKLAEESASEITKLVQENKILSGKLERETNDCGSQTNEDQLTVLKRENSELLAEMNEMNQALKERGETVSKQQEYCEELLRSIKSFEAQNNKNMEIIRQKEEIVSKLENDLDLLKNQSLNQSDTSFNEIHGTLIKKDEEIVQLRNELSVLHEKLNSSEVTHDTSYAESETMSTSTISRTEEMSRIKDLEGSWEERYGKLRTLALKLKGKIRDLTNELTKEQNEKADVQQKLANSLKTIQTLQAQSDKLQDEVDQSKKELKEYSKKLDAAALDISNNKKQLANNDELITKLKSDIEVSNKEKSSTDTWKKQVSAKVQILKKELEANNLLKKDYENQISKLNAQLEAKEKSLQAEIEKHNSTKNSLQESHNECKKQSVLNLEMQDYERSLKDLTQKLEKKQELVNKLKNQIDSQKSTFNAVKDQNRLLEERIQSEETDLTSARSEIQAYKKSISDLEMVIIQKEDKIQDLTRTLEDCRAENEDLATQLSKIVAENQKSHSTLKSEKDYLRSQNLGLEQKLREVEDCLKLKEDELKEIRKEYQGYKVRAKSVLRQSQTRDVGLEEKLSEEAASFKAQVAILTSEIGDVKNTVEKLKEDNARLKAEKDQMEVKYRNLESLMEERTKQLEALSAKHQKTVSEHAEAIRGLKVHAETLAQCYRQQLSEQEVRHNREIIELQSKMEKVVPAPEVPSLAPPTIPREQGEGSENVDTINHSHPVPLDRLLSNESDHDIGFVKKQLLENEAKVTHLTALLADTEQDLAKHVQMNKLLKEEIRRQQRSVEREKHAENLEYLKNVVFKFATLSSGDERSHLVPVLNTILKFSPEETNKLNMVARGDLGNRGWANYLPTWSTPGKPQ